MKKFLLAVVALTTIVVSAHAMSYEQACRQALFLTDKMAYELNLTDEQYEAAYEVNLDYLMSISNYDELYGIYWQQRNLDLSYILLDWQYRAYLNASYFYRPLYWRDGFWHFSIYARYPHRDYFYFGRPHFFHVYRGGHSWAHNGGHSWYHGRNYGPAHGRDHFGMRDGFDRGDFGRGHRGLDNGRGQGNVRGGNNGGGRHDIGQSRGTTRDVQNGTRPRSSFGNNGGGVERKHDSSVGNRQSVGGGAGNRQIDVHSGTRSRSNLDRSTSPSSVRESSTRQTVTRQGSDMRRSTETRSSERPSSSFSGSRSSSSSSVAPQRSIGSSQRSTSSSATRSYSAPSRSTSPSASRSYSAPSRSSSSSMSRSSGSSMSRGSAGASHGGGGGRSSGGGGHFGGHR